MKILNSIFRKVLQLNFFIILFLSFDNFLFSGKSYAEKLIPDFILGPGDRLDIKFYKLDTFNTITEILPDGTVNLPRVGTINLGGYSLNKANNILTEEYSKILKRPLIYINLLKIRPVNFSISGEIKRPGLYSLTNDSELSTLPDNNNLKPIKSSGWPSVVSAIQKAGGLNKEADIKNIKIIRKINNENKTINVNLWDLIFNNNFENNQLLFYGDSIFISKAKEKSLEYDKLISKTNLSSLNIKVNVVGEVYKPGQHIILSNSPASQAILTAGGLKASASNNVRLFRLNDNGSVELKKFKYNLEVNPENLPILEDGDVLVVKGNILKRFGDNMENITRPIVPITKGLFLYDQF